MLIFKSSWVVAKTIHARYHTRKFADAQSLCEDLLKQDPYRLDDMDVYSHILYVKEARSELSRLAHLSTKIDKVIYLYTLIHSIKLVSPSIFFLQIKKFAHAF